MADPVSKTTAGTTQVGMCVTCGRWGGLCRWTDDAEVCMRKQLEDLRATLREVRRDIEESADDVVWMRGGIETVCDRITAVLGDAVIRFSAASEHRHNP